MPLRALLCISVMSKAPPPTSALEREVVVVVVVEQEEELALLAPASSSDMVAEEGERMGLRIMSYLPTPIRELVKRMKSLDSKYMKNVMDPVLVDVCKLQPGNRAHQP